MTESYRMKKLWFYFRGGHGAYLMFFFSFVNFILLFYRLFIEPLEDSIFFNRLAEFAIFFVLSYVPVAIIIGYWHRTTQFKVEDDVKFLRNPLYARFVRLQIDVKLNKANKEEIEKFHSLLKKIEEKGETPKSN